VLKLLLLALIVSLPLIIGTPQGQNSSQSTSETATPAATRLYIEQRIVNGATGSITCVNGTCNGGSVALSRNLSLQATKEFVKSCPAVTITDNREAADYLLRIDRGDSTLYRRNGDVAYISPAKFKISNLVKDVCTYVRDH
jgi:hypothetical protein